ncbi:MAG: DUF2956 family protein [Methylococcales bacterium]|jgi:hypothetical protein|nr:DUF2956 family protein [Methylococcales bacterium]MBT7408113.1 DUF2956 family protein [Methylococcales bacterium]
MSKYKQPQTSSETIIEAEKIAKANQQAGQTKAQTKLIAQGIQKGINQYKKQQKIKSREKDRQRKKQLQSTQNTSTTVECKTPTKQHWLPWLLLLLTWLGIGLYFTT